MQTHHNLSNLPPLRKRPRLPDNPNLTQPPRHLAFHPLPDMANLTEVIGDPALYGNPISINAILPLIDMVAGRCAYIRAAGSVVTGSLDDVELLTTLHHGDVVSAEAEVVAVGTSSMLLRVWLSRDILHDGERRLPLAARCHATFVAVDEHTRKPRPIPPSATQHVSNGSTNSSYLSQTEQSAQDNTQATRLQAKYKHSRRIFATDDLATLHSSAESCCNFTTLYSFTPSECELQIIESTAIQIRKQYLPRHYNFSDVVFGGDILQTLERTAVACANRIQGGEVRLQTIGIRSLAFLAPVDAKKVLQVEAKVIAASDRVACVILRSYLDEGSEKVPCHHGIFHLIGIEHEGHDGTLSVGVRSIWKRDDPHIRDFYRAMALPLTSRVSTAWGLTDDVFPSEREDDWEDTHRS